MAKPPATPSCPRCGYDLSGDAATWTDRCPMRGLCSECGYSFAWREVMRPGLDVPRWFVEHPSRGFLPAAIGTLARSLRPAKFWAAIPLGGASRVRRSMAVGLAGVVLVWLLASSVRWCAGRWSARRWNDGVISTYNGPEFWPRDSLGAELALHIVLHDLLPVRGLLSDPDVSWAGQVRHELELAWTHAPLVAVLVAPLVYLVLPFTLGRAKVKRVHVLWATALSLAGVVLAVEAASLVFSLFLYPSVLTLGDTPVVLMLAVAAWATWRAWSPVNRLHFKLQRPRVVTAVIVVVSLFAGAAAGAVEVAAWTSGWI